MKLLQRFFFFSNNDPLPLKPKPNQTNQPKETV